MKAVFFDRDGVINQDFGYVYAQKDFVFNEGIFDLLKYCKERDFLLFVITNQSGIGRRYYSLEDFKAISDYMQNEIKKKLGFGFDGIYFCPHLPETQCECRKPKTGMINQAKKDYNIDLEQSFIIGDNITDMQAGQNANIQHKILVGKHPDENLAHFENLHLVAQVTDVRKIMQQILNT